MVSTVIKCDRSWADKVLSGFKTVIAQEYTETYKNVKVNDLVKFQASQRSFLTRVDKIKLYPSLEEYLRDVGIDAALPGVDDLETGLKIYQQWCNPDQVRQHGVIAIFVD